MPGLKKGDHVAVWGQNAPEWVILQFATGKVGAVLVTVNPPYRANDLEYAGAIPGRGKEVSEKELRHW